MRNEPPVTQVFMDQGRRRVGRASERASDRVARNGKRHDSLSPEPPSLGARGHPCCCLNEMQVGHTKKREVLNSMLEGEIYYLTIIIYIKTRKKVRPFRWHYQNGKSSPSHIGNSMLRNAKSPTRINTTGEEVFLQLITSDSAGYTHLQSEGMGTE